MESKHTLGKLRLLDGLGHFKVWDDDNSRLVAELPYISITSNEAEPRDKAHAHLIVDCVNACAGFDDPADLRKQRDALLEACKQLIKENSDGFGISHKVVQMCRDAIAPVEGY